MKKELAQCAALGKTIVFYESPHRILKTMEICNSVFAKGSRICLARELTKKFEEFIRGNIKEVSENIKNRKEILGEFVVLIYPETTDKDNE